MSDAKSKERRQKQMYRRHLADTSSRTMDSTTANLPVNGTDSGAKDKTKEVISQTNCRKREHRDESCGIGCAVANRDTPG